MYELMDLMPGARNCVQGYAFIEKGQTVLLWLDRTGQVDPLVVQAIALACEEAGAKTHILSSHGNENRLGESILTPGFCGHGIGRCPESRPQALENAAIVDNLHFARFLMRTGKRCVSLICPTPALLTSSWATFPPELLWALFRKTSERARSGKDDAFHLTAPNGTGPAGPAAVRLGVQGGPASSGMDVLPQRRHGRASGNLPSTGRSSSIRWRDSRATCANPSASRSKTTG